MKSSTLRRNDYSSSTVSQAELFEGEPMLSAPYSNQVIPLRSSGSSGEPRDSEFDLRGHAATLAGRIVAATATNEERNKLLAERESLVEIELAGTLSRMQAGRLAYIRWSLDRIEDARHGHVLDDLERSVGRYETFLEDLRGLQREISGLAKKPKRRGQQRR